jgi:hypothetical protein
MEPPEVSLWQKVAAIAAVVVLLISVWSNFFSPRIRRWRLKRPCKAYFHVREHAKGDLGYLVQDDEAHQLKEIVLPSDSIVELEVSYTPKVPFYVEETVFECAGGEDEKPVVDAPVTPFIARGEIPTETNFWNRHGGYHYATRHGGRAVGSWYTKGFKMRTKKPGVYKTSIGFIANEVNGVADDLVIRVEDKPVTRMRCTLHRGCHLRPCKVQVRR